MSIEAIAVQRGAGKTVSLRGTGVEYKTEGARPTGGPTFLEFNAAPGFSTGDHVHSRVEEIWYVVEGAVTIRAGDRMLESGPGDFVLVPPGVAHGVSNPGDKPAKLILVISPAGVHDSYFEELGDLLAKPGPPNPEAVAELRRRYDTEQLTTITAS